MLVTDPHKCFVNIPIPFIPYFLSPVINSLTTVKIILISFNLVIQ